MKRVILNMPDSLFEYIESKGKDLANTRNGTILYMLQSYVQSEKQQSKLEDKLVGVFSSNIDLTKLLVNSAEEQKK